jgi:2-polyprenyl-3-methyl-5-hydroxy-6-metoxy-1,4-benzoquinol methylase
MSEQELAEFYRMRYHPQADGADPSARDERIPLERARRMVARVEKHRTTVRRHLDVGASDGALLRAFRQRYACESVGIEPGETYRRSAEAAGLRMCASLEELAQSTEARFDVITLSHVLEHLPDPLRALENLGESWLEPNGLLLLEVPNLFGHQSLELAHLTCWSAATLRRVLALASFEVVELWSHGWPRSHILPLYLTVLAKPSRKVVPTERRSRTLEIRLRRRLGGAMRRLATRAVPRLAWVTWNDSK